MRAAKAIALLLALVLGGCAGTKGIVGGGPPAEGPGRIEIERFTAMYAGRPERREAARFLAANLPPADAASMSADELAENLDYAFLARETLPWGREVPTEVFLHYVLPHRLSQEPFQANRKRLYQELAPLVANCTDMAEAVAVVNQWCAARSGFRTTSRWDQGVWTTVRRGFGRCEENLILFAAAARAVGLPVRQAIVPFWQHSNDNHTWAEVWINGTWRHLEPAQVLSSPDKAWFTDPARRAPLVLSLAYGSLGLAERPILKRGPGYTLINSTAAYAPTRNVQVRVVDGPDNPVAGAEVVFSLFNYGSFRPALKLEADANGTVDLSLGLGTFLATVAHEGKKGFAFANMAPAGSGEPVRVLVDVGLDALPEGDAAMRFYPPEPGKGQPPADPALEALARVVEQEREAFFAGYSPLASAYLLTGRLAQAFGETPEAKALLEARGNAGEVMRALDLALGSERDVLWSLLTAMAAKDLVDCRAEDMVLDASLALQARNDLESGHGLAYDRETFLEFVAPGRIEYEPWSHWRQGMAEGLRPLLDAGVESAAKAVGFRAASLAESERGALGPVMTPIQALDSGWVDSEAARAVFLAAGLRSLGLPARYAREWDLVEFYDGTRWVPCFPDQPRLFGKRDGTALSRAYYADRAEVIVRFTRDGRPCAKDDMAYLRDFAIARFSDKGYFRDLRDSVRGGYDPARQGWSLLIPPGDYRLFAAQRNARGEAFVNIVPFTAEPGGRSVLDVALPTP